MALSGAGRACQAGASAIMALQSRSDGDVLVHSLTPLCRRCGSHAEMTARDEARSRRRTASRRSLGQGERERRGAPAHRGRRCRSEPKPGAGGHHRRAAGAHGGDDFLRIGASQIDAGRSEIGMSELLPRRHTDRVHQRPHRHPAGVDHPRGRHQPTPAHLRPRTQGPAARLEPGRQPHRVPELRHRQRRPLPHARRRNPPDPAHHGPRDRARRRLVRRRHAHRLPADPRPTGETEASAPS